MLAALLLPLAAYASPSDIAGTWLTPESQGLIQISVTPHKGTVPPKTGTVPLISGIIIGSAVANAERPSTDVNNPEESMRNRPLIGLEILSGFKYAGNGRWTGGTIYDPDNGKTYRCKLRLVDRDTLEVRGYIGVSLIGRTEVWKRQ